MGQAAQKEKRKERRTSVTSSQDDNEETEQNSTRTTDDNEDTDQSSTPALDDNEETVQNNSPTQEKNDEREQTSTPTNVPSVDGELKVSESDSESQLVEMKWKPKPTQITNKDSEPETQHSEKVETTKKELESKPKPLRIRKIMHKAVQSDPQLSQETKNTSVEAEEDPKSDSATKVKIVVKKPDDPRLTEQQENQLQKLFEELDVDGSGTLDTKETIYLLRCLGCNPTEEEVEDLMKYCNVDDDTSTLNYEEYRRIVGAKINMDKTSMRDNIEKAFDEFDRNGDGKLDKEELREALMSKGGNKMTEEECDDLFDEIDTDGDGKLEKKQLVDRICADFERMCQEGDAQENQGQDEES